MDKQQIIKDDLKVMQFLGVVVNVDDVMKKGRCQIRVFGKFDQLSDADLPWATPLSWHTFGGKGGTGSFSTPRKDAVVGVRFNNGNIYSPEYYSIQELSPDLLQEISGSYTNAHSIIYDSDENLQMFYTQQKGFTINLKGSSIVIANDNTITITHADSSSIIEMQGNNITVTANSEINVTAGSRIQCVAPEIWMNSNNVKEGHVPAYSAVRAEPLFAGLKALAAAVDAKMYPTPSAMSSMMATTEQLATSTIVKVS